MTYETPAYTNFIPCNVYLQKWYEIWGEIECYFKGIKESRVSKLQTEILLVIPALFFKFSNTSVSNVIRFV